MKLFEYPIDSKTLLRKKRSIKKELLAADCAWIDKRIAVLGGSTTNEIVDQLELFLLYQGIRPTFYQSEYGQYWQDSMFGNSELAQFRPDIIYIHTNWRNIEVFPNLQDSEQTAHEKLSSEVERFASMWNKLAETFGCPIIQNNFDRPDYRLLGNRDIWDYHGRSNYIAQLNMAFYHYAQTHENFYINDLDYLSSNYGLPDWNNPLYWYMYKYALCLDAIPFLAQSVSNIIKSIFGRNKKALVLDLDNTLWGGIIGDDGVEGIAIGPELSNGQAFSAFQRYCKSLTEIGIILAVNSKNEYSNAIAGLTHPYSILKPEDFVSIKANWNPKDQNLLDLSDELSLGTDSFVFVDDNPAERDIVSSHIPGVIVPDIKQPENYIQVLDQCGFFEVTALSKEDLNKTKLYHARAEASKARLSFPDYDDYLESLEMTAYFDDFSPIHVQRIAQLTNKSNQFNLTTLRCSEEDITNMQRSSNYVCLCAKLVDKFADNGLVAVAAGEQIGSELHIRMWLMSCRVLKRGLEAAMMNKLVEDAKAKEIKTIIGYYYPTKKNGMVKDFYESMQFKRKAQYSDGSSEWSLEVADYHNAKPHIIVKDNRKMIG